MKISAFRRFAVLGVGAALLAGCADGEPTLGSTIASQGEQLRAIGDSWTEGTEAIAEGQDLIARGRKMIAKGERMIARGEQQRRQAEVDYRAQTGQDLPVPE